MKNCKELFLEDIIEISLHPVAGCQFPIPAALPGIMSMANCVLSAPTLQLGEGENMLSAVQGSMSAKCTGVQQGNGVVYNINITAQVEDNVDEIRRIYNNLCQDGDYFIVLRKADDTLHLCYTLTNTFDFQSPVTIQGTASRQLSIALKAMSEFIPITLK